MVTSDSYVAKDGEVVLKIPRKSYELLAYRLVDIYLTKISESRTEIYWFLAEIIDTEMFQQNTHKLMTYFLQAFKEESHYNSKRCLKSVEYLRKPIFYELDICDEHMKSKTVFLANLLVTLANTEGQFKVYNCILEKYNQLIKTSNNYLTTKYMKAVLIKSLYEICSTKDVECVKSTLDLVKKEKITILLDQGINFTTLEFQLSHSNTVGYSYNTDNCVFLMLCIWKAYEAFNEPVLKHLLSMYNTIPFDVNLWLKTFYNTNWACWVEGLTSLSYKPLKWMMDRFIVDSDFILKAACQCHMLDTVEYLLSRYETFDAISCLKIFLYEDFDNLDFDKDLFNFLFSKIDITTPEMNNIVVAVLQKQHVPDYVCEAFLPVCINDEAILNLACKEAHIYITKLIIENSHNVNIQPALISVCKEKSTTNYVSDPAQDEVEKLKIFKFIVGKYGYEQFDLKVVCQQAYQNRKFRILEWLVMNIDLNRLDVLCIMNSALVRKSDIILECIIMMTDVKRLDKTEVLGSLIEHYSVSCSTQILEILGIIWDSSEDKKEFKIEKILDMAYEKKCFNLLTWIHENCNSHISIDPKKVLILACEDHEDGRTDVAKRILQTFGKKSLDINEGELFMLACDEISNWKYRDRRISMVEWVIETFQMKPLHNKLGLLKLLNNNVFRMESKRHKCFELVVSTLKKCLNYLCKEDKVEIMNKCLAQKYYDVVTWLFENESCCSFDQQTILNKACEDNQIETIKMLNKHFHLLDINEAVISACIGYDLDISVCKYLLKDIDHKSLDTRKIVTTVCKDYVSDNVMKFLLLQFSKDQYTINKVLMSCCHQGNFKLLKHIFRTIHNDQLDILTAFFGACLHPCERTLNSEENLYVIDFLFQKLQDKSNISSDVLNGLLANKRYDIILYFLEQGYCRIIDKSNLLIEACRHGHVKLVQWILQNVDHKELDIKAAFYEACTNCEDMDIKQLHCLSVMWHYIQDINLFEVDTVLKSMTEAPPCKLHVRAYVQDDLRKWLLYIKNINQTNDV